jgi:dimethylamine monooxygenase subunit A
MPFSLSELFPDQDHRFHLTLRKGSLAAFFGAPDRAVLAERRRWFADAPARYLVGEAEAAPLVAEVERLAPEWVSSETGIPEANGGSVIERLARLGGCLEPDIVLMAPDDAGNFRLRAGAVCFPSWWDVREKLGLTLEEIHGVVPGLNASLSPVIGQFLHKLRPGSPFERANWGLAATPELNLHPSLARPRLSSRNEQSNPIGYFVSGAHSPWPRQIWVRIEDQILAALPATGGILFGIRVRVISLEEILADPRLRAGLHRALVTMPDDLATYKGIAPVRAALVRLCSR